MSKDKDYGLKKTLSTLSTNHKQLPEKTSVVCKDSEPKAKKTTYKATKNEPTATANRYTRITKEPKTKRVNLVARPTVYADFQEKTKANGQSVNDALNDLMELYLTHYDEISGLLCNE